MAPQRGRMAPAQTKTTIWRNGHQWIDKEMIDGRTIVTFRNIPAPQIRQIAAQLRDTVIPSDALTPMPGKQGVFVSVYLQDKPPAQQS